MIFQRSWDVPELAGYKDYRSLLRRDFQYRCAYCHRHEFFFGGGEAGEIDHYHPRHLFPELLHTYSNLYWTCRKCNAFKGSRWPQSNQEKRGLRFLDPCAEDSEHHWVTSPEGTLTPITPTGQYTIRHIRLDRPTLVAFRKLFHEINARVESISTALMSAQLSHETRAVLKAELAALSLLALPPIFMP